MNKFYTETAIQVDKWDGQLLQTIISNTHIYSYTTNYADDRSIIIDYKFNHYQCKLLKIIKELENYDIYNKISRLISYEDNRSLERVFEFGNNITIAGVCKCTKNILGVVDTTTRQIPFTHTFKIYNELDCTYEKKIDDDNLLFGIGFIKSLIHPITKTNDLNTYISDCMVKKINDNQGYIMYQSSERFITDTLRSFIKSYRSKLFALRKNIEAKLIAITNRLRKSGCGIICIAYDFTTLDKYIEDIRVISNMIC